MNKLRLLGGVLFFVLIGVGFAYIVGTGFLSFWRGHNGATLDWFAILRDYPSMSRTDPRAFMILNLILGACVILALLFSAKVLTENLTTFGKSHWQTRRELKKNDWLSEPGRGFVVAKAGPPSSKAPFLCSAAWPHCLLVAPTGAGKGISFVIPNLLMFVGSAVVLDVKGENYELTSRHRQAQGDKIWRFAPLDWDKPSHRYNPLDRINVLPNADQRQMEIRLLAELFLQTEDDGAKGLLEGGIDLFVACGIFAMERGKATLGEIYRLASAGGDKQKQYMSYADKVKSPAARLIFERLASTNDRTLTSYLSLLMTSGLSLWSNPAIDRATETSDFNFRTFRSRPQTAYFIAPPHDKIRAIAPLVRLFFSDLLSSLHDHQPGPDEPWRVMIMLDEFDMLGRMPLVTDSIKTLRSYGGHLAVVTQTIPALDKIYGEDTRLSLQGGAGVKIYLAPSEQRTRSELSAAVGKTTHRVVSKSRTVGKGPFNGINVSERNEERDLLTEDEAGRLGPDDVIVLANGQYPIKARRIKYFEDRTLKPIFEGQSGPLPAPSPEVYQLRDALGELARVSHRVEQLEARNEQLSTQVVRKRAIASAAELAALATPKTPEVVERHGTPVETEFAQEQKKAKSEPFKRARRLKTVIAENDMIDTGAMGIEAIKDTTRKVESIRPPDNDEEPASQAPKPDGDSGGEQIARTA